MAVEVDHKDAGVADESPGMERIRFFSDGVFAIAITLLTLDLVLPIRTGASNLAHELNTLWPQYEAFAFTFILIGLRWLTHLVQFRYIRRYDYPLLALNLALLLVIAFLPFSSRVLADYPDSRAACALYAGSMAMAGLISTVLWWHACWKGHLADDPELDSYIRRNLLYRWAALPIFFSIAIVFVFVFPSLWPARIVALGAPAAQSALAARSRLTGHFV
jgi:uncharacterized membrane protein